jgi:long-subunit fatty acid transport protein
MKRNLLILAAALLCSSVFAQGTLDAFRLSKNDLQGTARGQAMGGAFGSLGGDPTGILVNPAGLGVYRSSEVSATMSFASTSIETNFNNWNSSQSNFKFNFDNIAYIGHYNTGNATVPVLNFSFVYNRMKNFDRRYTASRSGMGSSLTHYTAAISEGIDVGFLSSDHAYREAAQNGVPWMSILGWNGFFMNQSIDNTGNFMTDAFESPLFEGETVDPFLEVSEKGRKDSYDFSLGANVLDNLFIGTTFSFTDIFYRTDSYYKENFKEGGSIALDNYLQTEGTGYQVSLGVIWRPVDEMRIGVAYHSPTWHSLTDFSRGSTFANYGDVVNEAFAPFEGNARVHYRLQTPQSWVFSAAGVIGAKAIVSLDLEVKDYTAMSLRDNRGFAYSFDNQLIDEDFKVAATLRAGLEYRFSPQFSGRLGYSWMENPYVKEVKEGNREMIMGLTSTIPHYTIEGDVNYFTAGFGFRFTPQFYMDAAFVYGTQKSDLYYFSPVFNSPIIDGEVLESIVPTSFSNNTYKGLLTLGYRF